MIGASKVARDITERTQAEKAQQLLIEELNHRVKNTLTTVVAIASLLSRRAKGLSDFVANFTGRVQALAKAHTLLAQTRMEGAEVKDLVCEQVLLGEAGLTARTRTLEARRAGAAKKAVEDRRRGKDNARVPPALNRMTGSAGVSERAEAAGMGQTSAVEAVLRRDRLVVAAGLGLVAIAAWAWTLAGVGMPMSADGDDMAMGTMATTPAPWSPSHAALIFLMWWVMMAAMMVPSAAPLVLLAAALHRRKGRDGRPALAAAVLTAGYLAVWGMFSLAATLVQWGLEDAGVLAPETMAAAAPALVGGLLLAAGLYQLTPLKQACLRRCRSPVEFLTRHWRPGRAGAFRLGLAHGAYCVGCCWFLMALLFVGGIMNLFWIGAIALYVLVEKLAPRGHRLSRASGLLLAGWGVATLALVAW